MVIFDSRLQALEWRSWRTLSDPVFLVNFVTTIFGTGVFLFGAYRAIRIGRVLVSRVFRNRAYWIAALMISGAISSSSIFFPVINNPIYNLLSFLPFFAVLVIILAFVDSTIFAAAELDFFHRDSLHWSKSRIPLYIILISALLISIPGIVFYSNSSFWQTVTTISVGLGATIVLAYSVMALIVSARRTFDKTMKRFVKLLGASLGCFVFGLLVSFVNSTSLPYVLVSDAFTNVISIVILYQAVMSLSPISHKEIEAA
ncbi:MAG: hypothetical protein OK439_07305 [Thaumarchaeota archaeon]|nr:hypothetical protein [Nitrososphaerota archaeon]